MVLFGDYFMGTSGAVGGLLGLVVTARLEPLVDIAVWASAGAISALLSFSLYIAGRAVVRWALPAIAPD
jgi:hypothetical protein